MREFTLLARGKPICIRIPKQKWRVAAGETDTHVNQGLESGLGTEPFLMVGQIHVAVTKKNRTNPPFFLSGIMDLWQRER